MEVLHPGVYLQELPSGVKPIEAIGTSTAAFIGKAQMGALTRATLVTGFPQFEKLFGTYLSDGFLAHSVFNFFVNGGGKAYIVRVAGTGVRAAAIVVRDRKLAPLPTITFRAASPGAWGNNLDLVITDSVIDPQNTFSLQVFRDRSDQTPPQPPELLETFESLSLNPTAADYVERAVNGVSLYVVAEVDAVNAATAGAGTSRSGRLPVGNGAAVLLLGVANGGTETPGAVGTAGTSRSADNPSTNPPADQRRIRLNLNGDGVRDVTLAPAALTGADIAASLQAAVRALTPNNPALQAAYTGFTAVFDTSGANPFYLLTSGTTGATSTVVVTDSTAVPLSLPAGTHRFQIDVNGDGPHLISLTGPLGTGPAIATAIETAVRAVLPKRAANAAALSGFTAAYDAAGGAANPSLLLTSGAAGANSAVRVTNATANNAAGLLRLGVTNTGTEVSGTAILRPANSQQPTEYHLGDAVVVGNVVSVVMGDDGATPGDTEHRNGLTALDTVRDVSIIAVPGIGSLDVVASATNYCTQRMDCFFIGDMNMTDDTVEEARTFVNSLTVKSSYGAVYYPWLRATDPTGRSTQPIALPPSGFVAGMYARIDARRGVFKAPAGTEANIGGATGLVADTTDAQQDFLNPVGVNVIRSFPASGIVIWGARTLATRSDPEYRYVPVRRTAIFLEFSILNGIQYAVFEPNGPGLWSSLRLNIGAFMTLQFRAGMFAGGSANEAFFVKCDETTTTQQDIDAGIVNILVGFAPLKPAEFVILRLTQIAGQPAA